MKHVVIVMTFVNKMHQRNWHAKYLLNTYSLTEAVTSPLN